MVALGAIQHAGVPGLTLFDLDEPFSLPALATAAILLAGAALALLGRAAGARGAWTVVAAVLAALGAEKLLGAHERVQAQVGLGWAIAWLPAVVAATVALVGAAWLLRARPPVAIATLAGAGAWTAGQALEGAFGLESLGAVAGEALELAGAALVFLALLSGSSAWLAPPAAGESAPRDVWGVVERAACELDPRRVGLVLAAVIALLAGLGGLVAAGLGPYVFDLNAEQNIPAAAAAAMSAGAAACAHLLWRGDRSAGRWWWWAVMAVVLGFLAVDELGVIHEDIQEASGIHPGQLVLLPLVVVAGLGWIAVLLRMKDVDARRPWIAGAAAWVAAQTIDATQPPNQFVWTVVPEEALEMAGSALLGLGLLITLQAIVRAREAQPDAAPSPPPVPASSALRTGTATRTARSGSATR